MTDPSYAGQLIAFTYPADRQLRRQRRGDGVRPRPRPRGDHARRGRPRRRAGGADRVAALADRAAASRRSPTSTPARWCATSATRARCAAACSRHASPRPRARELIEAEPSMTGRDLAREVTPREPVVLEAGTPAARAADRDDRHRRQALDRRQPPQPRGDGRAASVHGERGEQLLASEPDAVFLANGPGDPGALRLHRRDRPRAGRQAPGVRDLPRPSAPVPGGRASRPTSCRSATTAPTIRSRT